MSLHFHLESIIWVLDSFTVLFKDIKIKSLRDTIGLHYEILGVFFFTFV